MMVGDFFIAQYLDLARSFSDVSLETGLEAYQVVDIRSQLGAAGTVANNLCAMRAKVKALTLCGEDGNGYLMLKLMQQQGILTKGVLMDPGTFTPTYIKPMMIEKDGLMHELNRMDIKNRCPIAPGIEEELSKNLARMIPGTDAILVTDQVQEEDCGVVTECLRVILSETAKLVPGMPIWVDSRERGHLYEGVALKMNLSEAKKVLQVGAQDVISAETAAAGLFQKNQKPVLITDGVNGISYCDERGSGHVPALKMESPLDIVGAGDSVLAGVGLAMAAGATLREAALIGCLAASVTIKKIGTTGTASIPEMLENLSLFEAQYPAFRL
jgi:rfaE bifunctional protein kinase chain/domain